MTGQSLEQLLSGIEKIPSGNDRDSLKQLMAERVNQLILTDFDRLLHILYRVDVDERKLRRLLSEHPSTDAAVIIADMLLSRQEEKIKMRSSFPPPTGIPEEDQW